MATPSIAIIPSAYKEGVLAAVLPNNGIADLDFTRGTTARRINAQGLIQEEGVNVPRLDYSDGSCPSLLLEQQSKNLITYSEDFNNVYWKKDKLAVVSNSIISPSGVLNASLIQETIYTSAIPSFDLNSSISLTAGTYTFSFYVKNNNGRYLGISFGSNAERIRTNFDFTTKTFKTPIFNGTTTGLASFITLGDYDRISITATFTSSIGADAVIIPLATDTYPFYAFQDSDNRSFYLWGAQLEQQSFATSYIPNFGTAEGITRLAETASKTGLQDYINSSEGVLYANISASEYSEQIQRISISDSSDENKIHLQFIKNTNGLNVLIRSADAPVFEKPYILNDVTAFNKIALKWKINDFSLWVNGVNVWSINAGNTPLVLNRIGFDSGNNTFPFYGKCKDLRIYTTALSDTELQTLTTL